MDNPINGRGRRVAGALGAAALALLLVILLALALGSMTVFARLGLDGPYEDSIRFLSESLSLNLLLTAAALTALLGMRALMRRLMGVRLTAAMMAAWTAGALLWVLAVGLISETDFGCVVDSAERFAQGDYELLHWGYFRGSSYQLGICLVIDTVKRLLPMLDVDIVMQCLNVLLSVGFMGMLAAFGQEVLGVGAQATLLLSVLYLPALLYNHYVYGTLPMLFFGAAACLCFARYIKTKRTSLLAAMMFALALGYVLKPNGVVVTLALLICGVLHALACRDAQPMLFALGALLLGYGLSRLVIFQYELRAGFPLDENQSLLTWLVMAITPAEGVTPGWYTGYAGVFYDLYLPREEQSAIVMADLGRRLGEIAADPMAALQFFKEKILSQWMEPTVSVMTYGLRCEYQGRFNGLALALFREGTLNDVAIAYMNLYQQVLYGLACIGTAGVFKKRGNAAALALPVIVIGGFLFHTLMEAKSQYIYPYMMYMMPLAALGLERLSGRAARRTGLMPREAKKEFGDSVPGRV